MSQALNQAATLLPSFKTAVNDRAADLNRAADMLRQLKILMISFPSQSSQLGGASSSAPSATIQQETAICRDILLWGAILSVRLRDAAGFERNYAQLKPYLATGSGASDAERHEIIGLFLIHLLVENRLAQFHMELELLSAADKAAPTIAFPLKLESYLMEGNYNKILQAAQHSPSQLYMPFLDRFLTAVRRDIAESAAAAYKSLTLAGAAELLMFGKGQAGVDALMQFISKEWFGSLVLRFIQCEAMQPTWTVAGGSVHFQPLSRPPPVVEATTLISNTLAYATEMERIV